MFILSTQIHVVCLLLLSTAVDGRETMSPTLRPTEYPTIEQVPVPVSCKSGYDCWEDSDSDVVWVVGGGTADTCESICTDALNVPGEEYLCKADQPRIPTQDDFNESPISAGLGIDCRRGWCWGAETGNGSMWVARGLVNQETERHCYMPSTENFSCDTKVGNANCVGIRYHQLCPCVKDTTTCPAPQPFVPCNEGYTCWKDDDSDIVWTTGGHYNHNCRQTCLHAHSQNNDFYSCKSDEPLRKTEEEFQPISDGMGINCEEGGCWSGSQPGQMWMNSKELQPGECDRTCYLPKSGDYYDCHARSGNANCFGERYSLVCPCNPKALDEACEWSCPDHSAPVSKWPDDIETGTSCLARINYWRKKACEDGWPECPPNGLPPITECTSCHQCVNTQSEYDLFNGSHASFTRCGDSDQGSGIGATCADVIDAFVAGRDKYYNGECRGHCTPIVYPGCTQFSWGRSKDRGDGRFQFTLNWGSCNTNECDAYCESVAGTDDACFASGIETPGCSVDEPPFMTPVATPTTSVPTLAPIDPPTDSPTNGPTLAPVDPPSDPPVDPPSDPPVNPPSQTDEPCTDGGSPSEAIWLATNNGVTHRMTCEELARQTENKIAHLCSIKVSYKETEDGTLLGPADVVCPETCNACSPCYENPNSKFTYTVAHNGRQRRKKCSWLATRAPRVIEDLCNDEEPWGFYASARETCPQTCGECEATE